MRPLVEPFLLLPPVEVGAPRLTEISEIREIGAVVPRGVRDLVGPARAGEAIAKIVEHGIGDVDAERAEFVGHGRTVTACYLTVPPCATRGRYDEYQTIAATIVTTPHTRMP